MAWEFHNLNPLHFDTGASEIKCWWPPRNPLTCSSLSLISKGHSSFGDADWADQAVPDVQQHLRVHADIIITCDGVLCRNLIHWQRYKRAVDVAWTAGPATTIEQSYPLGGPSPCR